MGYPEAVNLPFNSTVLNGDFMPVRPGEKEPAGPGFWVILQGSALVVRKEVDKPALCEGKLPGWAAGPGEPLCIGSWRGKPLRAVRIDRGVEIPAPFVAELLNSGEGRLDDRLLTLGGLALQVLYWERNSALCGRCGGKTERITGTWGKRCQSCGYEHYPHIHPCIIVLVKRGDEFLLVRKPEWPQGRYSLIAGFLDFGECLEECVRREVREEAGIEVKNLRYIGSQNWPFPSQLMAGYVADYAGGEIVVDKAELADARWFCSEAMPELLPGDLSIARWIIDRFALGKN